MGYRRAKVSLEYDGRHHAADDEQWGRRHHQARGVRPSGWRMVIVTSPGLWSTPDATLERVAGILRSRGADARVTSTEWRRYFGRAHERTA